jgi:hypothetical protein
MKHMLERLVIFLVVLIANYVGLYLEIK